MTLKTDLEADAKYTFETTWKRRDGTVVPTDTSVTLGNDAVDIDATVLYADLADSTLLVDGYKDWFAAEVYKTFLYAAARIIRAGGGEITAYDGDRIMAVYIGDTKNTAATKSALKINWAVKNIIQPAIKSKYPTTTYVLKHVCGIDTSKLMVAKTGIRGSNDLVWVGKAANYAAKLAALDDAKATWITKRVYDKLADEAKYSNGANMWVHHTWSAMNNLDIYASTFWWSFS
jgi:class 3 adenylate cyclase